MGTSPYQFILNLRFRKAEEMLTDNRYTISEIAYACGFHKVHDFSAQFIVEGECGLNGQRPHSASSRRTTPRETVLIIKCAS